MAAYISRVGCVLGVTWLAAGALAQSIERVSVSSAGVEGNASSWEARLSADGSCVAFTSNASNLVGGDANGFQDVFVRDRISGTTTCASVNPLGVPGNGGSEAPSLSGDGRYAAFHSFASNLVPNDTNATYDVFVRDRVAGTTERVSVASSGTQANDWSWNPWISLDGRYVGWRSYATNLATGDTNNVADVFVRDRQLGQTALIGVNTSGVCSDSWSYRVILSTDASLAVFASEATNLVPGDTNLACDVFVRSLQSGQVQRASVSSTGAQGNGESGLHSYCDPVLYACFADPTVLAISADKRYLAFDSVASNLVAGDTSYTHDVFVRDMQTGVTTCISVKPNGIPSSSVVQPLSFLGGMTPDARYVVFDSSAPDLVAGDSNGERDVFLRDTWSGATTRVSLADGGAQADDFSYAGNISADGRYVVFSGPATNLVPGDTNGTWDVFVRDLGPHGLVVYCTAGTTAHGCVATISSSGTPSASPGAGFTIDVVSVEGQKAGLVFYGLADFGLVAVPWGAGSSFLCVKPPTQRTPQQNSAGTLNQCDGALAVDWNAYVAAHPGALGTPFAAGQRVFAQAWFRDPSSAKTTSLSNALAFDVGP